MSENTLVPVLIVIVLIALILVLFLPGGRFSQALGASSTGRRPGGPSVGDEGYDDRFDDQHWYAVFFYYNPDDPNPFVPKRYGLGWTINFAHPAGKFIAVIMVAMLLAPIALAIFNPGFAATGCHPENCHLAP